MKAETRITDIDIRMYKLLHEAVDTAPYTLAKSVPTFLINESLWFFQNKEEYEKCHVIKSFFDSHPEKRMPFSRKDYMDYGWELVE